MQEDRIAAAGIHANISSQIFAASLVLLGVLIGYLDIKEIEYGSLQGVLTIISIISLLISLIFAGIGLKKLRDNGSSGNWDLTHLHKYFRAQTILNFFSILLFIVIVFTPNNISKEEKFQKDLIEIQTRHLKLDSIYTVKFDKHIKDITRDVDSLKLNLKTPKNCKKRK